MQIQRHHSARHSDYGWAAAAVDFTDYDEEKQVMRGVRGGGGDVGN